MSKHVNDADYVAYRIRMLPEQLDRARRRVAQLEREAISLHMEDLVYEQTEGGRGYLALSRSQDHEARPDC